MKDIVDLIARIFLAFIFLYEAVDSFLYFEETKTKLSDFGLTYQNDIVLMGAIAFLLIGGLLLLTGYRSSLGVTMLLIYWVPVTFIVHSFWNDAPDCVLEYSCLDRVDEYRRIQGIMFVKNLAIIGGLLTVWVNGSGRYSIRRLFATTRVPKKWN